jgi:predicted nucleic acid-binding protein
MSYLLDTCVVSELIKKIPEPAVIDWVRKQDEERLYLSVITLGEIQKGIAQLAESRRQRRLQEWLDVELMERFRNRLLDVTPQVATLWGQIQGKERRMGRTLPVLDNLIAATALAFNAAIVTRNGADMEGSGARIINPWPQAASSHPDH